MNMNKIFYFFILTFIFCGCATITNFVTERDYDVGRSVDLIYDKPSKIVPYNQTQDKYLFECNNGCKFAYYVNKETKVVESWEYISSSDKCSLGQKLFGPW